MYINYYLSGVDVMMVGRVYLKLFLIEPCLCPLALVT